MYFYGSRSNIVYVYHLTKGSQYISHSYPKYLFYNNWTYPSHCVRHKISLLISNLTNTLMTGSVKNQNSLHRNCYLKFLTSLYNEIIYSCANIFIMGNQIYDCLSCIIFIQSSIESSSSCKFILISPPLFNPSLKSNKGGMSIWI